MQLFVLLTYIYLDITGEAVIPVIISIRNGGIDRKMLKRAINSNIPIIRFEVKHFMHVITI